MKVNKQIPGLQAIRGLAAITVVLAHIDQFHETLHIDQIGLFQTGIADYAVTIFFVLSGFLITYLLLDEKRNFRTIDIKNFYVRRMLRIWPAYYATIIFSLTLMVFGVFSFPPLKTLVLGLTSMILLAPNLGYVFYLTFAGTSPLWSIGVEEQFYLVWPWIVSKTSRIFHAIFTIVVVYIIIKLLVYYIDADGGLFALIKLTRVDCMAIGGLFSLMIHQKKIYFIKATFHPFTQMIALLALLSPFVFNIELFGHLQIEIYALASAVWICNSGFNAKSKFQIKSSVFDFLGKLSYGIYVYHLIIIYLVGKYTLLEGIVATYISVLAVTLAFAWLSFNTLEKYFLKRKRWFEVRRVKKAYNYAFENRIPR